jgi:protein-disulfide isomerase
MKLIAVALAALLPCLAASMVDADKAKAIGNPAAPIRMDVFTDFECPACAEMHRSFLPLVVHDYATTGKIYVVNHEFPLNIPDHKYSHEAANYATAAARVGKYMEVSDTLFQTQAAWHDNGKYWDLIAKVLTPAEQKKVQELVRDPAVVAEVNADVMWGQRQAINSTPTVIITRGARQFSLPWPINYSLFRSMIDGLLK